MEQVTINGKTYPLTYGMEFFDIRRTRRGQVRGHRTGAGLEMTVSRLYIPGNIVAFYDLIKAGTATLKQKPSNDDIEEWIFENTEDGGEKLRESFLHTLKNSRLTSRVMDRLENVEEVQQAQQQAQEVETKSES
ncbi:Phage protein [Alloiococcus otitis]|uniref:tail assembly chaperone n=1 Tax=Alloiococcus otitis TaxID=1652 RepID=UPI000E1284C2|nr:tail assembly chaperone [Alloiococcus otitis]SUU80704.1 Phage protein [Alloiococcus otitis]